MEEIAFELGRIKKEKPIEVADEKIDIPESREQAHPCPRCQGSGQIKSPAVGYPRNYMSDICPDCYGRGVVDSLFSQSQNSPLHVNEFVEAIRGIFTYNPHSLDDDE